MTNFKALMVSLPRRQANKFSSAQLKEHYNIIRIHKHHLPWDDQLSAGDVEVLIIVGTIETSSALSALMATTHYL